MHLPETYRKEMRADDGSPLCIELVTPMWGEREAGFEWQVQLGELMGLHSGEPLAQGLQPMGAALALGLADRLVGVDGLHGRLAVCFAHDPQLTPDRSRH